MKSRSFLRHSLCFLALALSLAATASASSQAAPDAPATSTATQRVFDLNGSWSFAWSKNAPEGEYATLDQARRAGLTFHEARVPGNLELDLQRTGQLDDPFYAMNILGLRELESANAWYSTRFDAASQPGHSAELVFEGIDCYASIYLNGELLGRTDNMLVEHVFDVTSRLRPKNELLVHISSARDAARQFPYPPNVNAMLNNYESLYVRKAPHMYGWDIMPRALSAGIWRPVSLRFRPTERMEWLYLQTKSLGENRSMADMRLRYLVKRDAASTASYQIRLEGACGESRFETTAPLSFDAGMYGFGIPNPRLWWPNGYGAADLYHVKATLLKQGQPIDEREFSFGVRTVALERTSTTDEKGNGQFCLRVNGEKIFAKGSNWVPLDAFHSRDLERTQKAVQLAVDAHCNILRCWGGNVYESDRFFNLCDENGLMVWQDFAMACAVYPQDDDFARRFGDEARKVVQRLRQHPSIVLWAGDNECDLAWLNWYGVGDPNRNILTRKVLPDVLRQEDPARPYLPSSPYMDEVASKTTENYLPENHLWGPRGYYKAEFYRNALCHFASEIGYHGCPSPESIRKFISPGRVWPFKDNPEWNLHSTCPVPDAVPEDYARSRVELMANQARLLFGTVPDNLEDFSFASQATQAEAKKTFIEMFRSGKWRRSGIIWWNLLDGWPQFSDAVVDYYFSKKLAYDFITRSQQHVCVMCREPEGTTQTVVACNDTLNDQPIRFEVRDIDTNEQLASGETTATANAVTELARIPFAPDKQRFYVLTWSAPGSDAAPSRNHYLAGSPPFDLARYRSWLNKAGLAGH